ncbi:1-aminocyclopropane-1-carboxylate deaminase/D-cysteine desulfhydrase [Flavobacterium sp.]|uniref:1-aminocyclopropane-1-carboxylate deaminase/D-cysteine desulfhydrase n=1 Tax=Flavobacterium sp. TaxID=239 RepID=UPI003D0C952D
MKTPLQQINISLPNGISLYLKREDTIHPYISGNKYRKLKYNLLYLQDHWVDTLVTFGGAFSNHIAATAYACHEKGISCVGVIRGEELWKEVVTNPTLKFAQSCGMKFEFVTREQYRDKEHPEFLAYLQAKYGTCYLLPEGGTNALAVQGCEEILGNDTAEFDYICTAVGTGGTISGLINSSLPHQKVLGFPALKGDFLTKEIQQWTHNNRWQLIHEYHFGGYAKVTEALIAFLNAFYEQTQIPLDPVYTGKLLFGVYDLITKGYFTENSKILAVHTGGLQGIAGMNQFLQKKNKTLIAYADALKNQ